MTKAATLAFLVCTFPIKLPIRYANWNDWPGPDGCEHGATLDEWWTSMCRVRPQPGNRRRTREGRPGRRLLARRTGRKAQRTARCLDHAPIRCAYRRNGPRPFQAAA